MSWDIAFILAHRRARHRRDLPARRARPGADLLGHAGRLRAVRRHRRVRGAEPGGVRDRPPAADDRPGADAGGAGARSTEVVGLVRRGAASRGSRRRSLAWGVLPAAALRAGLGRARGARLPALAADRRRRSRWWCRSRRCWRALTLQPIADASVLVLLIVSLALHFLLSGLGLLFFGPEGSRTQPLVDAHARRSATAISISGQTLLMVASAIVLSGLFFLVLRAHADRQGAARDRGQPGRRAAGRHPAGEAPRCSPTPAPRCSPA